MSEVLLEARDLHRGFRSGEAYLPVVNGVNFTLFRGEMVAIVGALISLAVVIVLGSVFGSF